MPKRIPTISVVVIRKADSGKNVRKTVEPGKPFNFTDAEIEQITRIHPGALRKPVNETATAVEEDVEDAEDEDEDDLDTGDTEEEGEAGETTATEGVAKKAAPKKAAAKAKAKPAADADDDI